MQSNIYNENLKQQYMEFDGANADSIKRYFVRIASKEFDYSKDIVEMTQDELIDTFKSLNIRREESRGHFLSLIKSYVNWAILNDKTQNGNAIARITPESIGTEEAVKDNMIKSPEHLQEILDDALDRENYENKSKMCDLLFWLLYQGIRLEEIQALKKDSIDFNTNTVTTILGTEFSLSDDIARLWKECATITYYEKKNGKSQYAKSSNVSEYVKYDLVDNKYLFRSIVGNKVNTNTMMNFNQLRKLIAYVFDACEKKTIPARNINYSGIFYKLYLLEKEGHSITPEIIAKYFRIKYNASSNLPTVTRKWRIDFEDWKLAFDYM
jgi:integrase